MSEDPNEQLGKLINGGYFFEDRFDEKIKNNFCPVCNSYAEVTEDTNYRRCTCCKALIQTKNKIH